MGSRCDQRDQIQPILLRNRCKFFFFFKRNIRKDYSIHFNLCCSLAKTLDSIRKNNIRIGHKYHWDGTVFANFFYHIKDFICGNSTGQSTQVCTLDNRSFCCRIRKWNTKFDQICTCFFHGIDDFFGNIKGRIPAGNKWNKCLSFRKCFCNPLIHGYPPLCNVQLLHSPCLLVRKW